MGALGRDTPGLRGLLFGHARSLRWAHGAPMSAVDLNADLGEGVTDDPGLLAVVTSANVACGSHAGDVATMTAVCQEAARLGVAVGAQVSYDDRASFGRARLDVAY